MILVLLIIKLRYRIIYTCTIMIEILFSMSFLNHACNYFKLLKYFYNFVLYIIYIL